MFRPILLSVFLLLHAGSPLAQAERLLLEPFAISNQSPLIQIYGLPPSRGAALLGKGHWSVDAGFVLANSFRVSEADGESLTLDGETYRGELTLRRGVADNWEMGVRLPFVAHDGGFMDSLIEDWHDLFHLPNSNREDFPQDVLQISYTRSGEPELALTEEHGGLGDIAFNLGYAAWQNERSQLSLRAGIELPSGDEDKLTGSGSYDFFSSVHYTRRALFQVPSLHAHLSAGLLYMEHPKVLRSVHRTEVAYGSASVVWRAFDSVALKAQFDSHTNFYKSKLDEIGDASAQLVFGATFLLKRDLAMDLAVSEDIDVGSSPDIAFQLVLRWQPR